MAVMESVDIPRFFRYTDGALLRAVPYTLPDLGWPAMAGDEADLTAHWYAWLRKVWAHQEVATAVKVASPTLASRVGDVVAGRPIEARRLHRMVFSMVRYLARMTGRATPFGLFAGVAATRFTDRATVTWGQRHHAVADADAGWLTDVITRLESCPQLVTRLPVVLNNGCFLRGDRLVLPYQGHAHRNGRLAPREVSVRYTPAVQTVLEIARTPIRWAEVATYLAAAFSSTPETVIEAMLMRLVSQGILVSGLRAPGTVPDALGHLLGQLTAVNACEIPQVAAIVGSLREIYEALAAHNRVGQDEFAEPLRQSVLKLMSPLTTSSTRQPLKTDLRLDCEVTVPEAVAHEAELAATALIRVTQYPYGVSTWQDYHKEFVERYGVRTMVPLMDLVDPGSGLGFPAGYTGSERAEQLRSLSARDSKLLTLAQRATADGQLEVVLDEAGIGALEVSAPGPIRAPSHVEICVEVHACDVDALTRGDFTLTVTATPRAAGTVTGRFAGLLDPADREPLAAALATLPGSAPAAAVVQVSFPPLAARSGNIIRSQAFTPQVISLGEHRTHSDELIGLDDLAVGSDGTHLFLTSLSTGHRLEPTVFHALEFRVNTPPVARFLCEIGRATSAFYGVFDWGVASVLPFLPRIRYRSTVLSPARWNLPASELAGQAAPWPEWTASLAQWRRRFRVPAAVHLWEADRRLELDLDQEAHQAVLRAQLVDEGHAILTDAPDPHGRGWLDGRASELVIPLISASAADPRPAAGGRAPSYLVGRDHGHLPGRPPWLVAKVYAPTREHCIILRDYVPHLLALWDTPPDWWFVRYLDPRGPHLRLRIRVPDERGYAQATGAVGAWMENLRRDRLAGEVLFDTYYPEVGRYGGGTAMSAAEAMFAADSQAVLAQMAVGFRDTTVVQAVTAASLTDIAIAFTGDREGGLGWLVGQLIEPGAVPRDAAVLAVRLVAADTGDAALSDLLGSDAVRTAWQKRANALTRYRTHLATETEIHPDSVLVDLLHMHHNRVAGIDAAGERVCLRLARAAALSWTRRTAKAGTR